MEAERDHVLMACLSPGFMPARFFAKRSSIYGPFLKLRAILGFLLLFSSFHDKCIRPFFWATRLHSQGVFAPWSFRIFHSPARPAFPSSMRMVNRIHGSPSHVWPSSFQSGAPGIFHSLIHEFRIGNCSQRSEALTQDLSHLA